MKSEIIGKVKLDYTYYNPEYIYNEGDDVEELILKTVKKTTDYKEYERVIEKDTRWPILYQLARQRENIIEPMDIKKNRSCFGDWGWNGSCYGSYSAKM